jgi:hypothetical protein
VTNNWGVFVSVESASGLEEGTMVEGFVIIPLSENIAMRFVGRNDDDGGYIDSVSDSITFPLRGITRTNEKFVEDNFNDAVKEGYRAALRVELNDSWKIDANFMGQETETDGVWDHNPEKLGKYNVSRVYEDTTHDEGDRCTVTVTGE